MQNCFFQCFRCYIVETRIQGLQAFAFSVVTVNDKHTKPKSKRKRNSCNIAIYADDTTLYYKCDSTCCFLATGRDGLCELETTFSGMGVNY